MYSMFTFCVFGHAYHHSHFWGVSLLMMELLVEVEVYIRGSANDGWNYCLCSNLVFLKCCFAQAGRNELGWSFWCPDLVMEPKLALVFMFFSLESYVFHGTVYVQYALVVFKSSLHEKFRIVTGITLHVKFFYHL